MTAYAYVRKSVLPPGATSLSPAVQEERVRALATAHGDADLEVLSDLDMSGKRVDRPRYLDLVAAIEDGRATTVYAYDLSRLHRNTREALRFFELADRKGVPIRLVADAIDTSTATGRMVLTMLAAVNQMVSDVTSEKIKLSLARRQATTGERNGGRVYPRPELVMAAFRQAGSYTGAARLLNSQATPTRNAASGAKWHAGTVRSVLSRVPGLDLPETSRGAAAGPRASRLARLLRCGTCGTFLTPSYDRRHDYLRYYCHRGSTEPHARKTIPESALLAAIGSEVERAMPMVRRLQKGTAADEAKGAELAARRDRIASNYEDGAIDKPTRDARLLAVAEAEGKLSARRSVLLVRIPVALDDDPTRVNEYLRRLLDHVELDAETMMPVAFAWRDPALRISNNKTGTGWA